MPKLRAFKINPLPLEVQASLEHLGQHIAKERKARGLSQREMADMAGISAQTMMFLEQGRPTVQIGHYARAAWLLELRDVQLLGGLSIYAE